MSSNVTPKVSKSLTPARFPRVPIFLIAILTGYFFSTNSSTVVIPVLSTNSFVNKTFKKSCPNPPAIAVVDFVGSFPNIPDSSDHFAGPALLIIMSHCSFSKTIGAPTPPGDSVVRSIFEPLGSPFKKILDIADAY